MKYLLLLLLPLMSVAQGRISTAPVSNTIAITDSMRSVWKRMGAGDTVTVGFAAVQALAYIDALEAQLADCEKTLTAASTVSKMGWKGVADALLLADSLANQIDIQAKTATAQIQAAAAAAEKVNSLSAKQLERKERIIKRQRFWLTLTTTTSAVLTGITILFIKFN